MKIENVKRRRRKEAGIKKLKGKARTEDGGRKKGIEEERRKIIEGKIRKLEAGRKLGSRGKKKKVGRKKAEGKSGNEKA